MTPRHVLINTLLDQYRAERVCIGRLTHINASELLTEQEHEEMHKQISDEVRHARLMHDAIERYSVSASGSSSYDIAQSHEDYHAIVTADEDPAMGLAEFCAIERYIGAMLPKAAEMFRAAGDEQTAIAYDVLDADDSRHIPFNRALLKRLYGDPTIGYAIRSRYIERVREGHFQDFFRKAAQSEMA